MIGKKWQSGIEDVAILLNYETAIIVLNATSTQQR